MKRTRTSTRIAQTSSIKQKTQQFTVKIQQNGQLDEFDASMQSQILGNDVIDQLKARKQNVNDESGIGIRMAPVFTPTEQEFQDPMKYVQSIQKEALQYGICKIVPPPSLSTQFSMKQWLTDQDEPFRFNTRIQRVSELDGSCRQSLNFITALARYHLMYRDFSSLKEVLQQLPRLNGSLLDLQRLHNEVDTVLKESGSNSMTSKLWSQVATSFSKFSDQQSLQIIGNLLRQHHQTWIAPFVKFLRDHINIENYANVSGLVPQSELDQTHCQCYICNNITDFNDEECANCEQQFHFRCVPETLRQKVLDDHWYCDRCVCCVPEYSFQIGQDMSLKEFYDHAQQFALKYSSVNNIDLKSEVEVEREFWKLAHTMADPTQVMYAADLATDQCGSGFPNTDQFDDKVQYSGWYLQNLSKLSLLKHVEQDISGMVVPWMYIGMLFSAFCWHNEDHYSYSINYNHFGATKTWYGVPASDASKFEQVMSEKMPDLFANDPSLLSHITTTLDPRKLITKGVSCYQVNQRPNEFVVTFPQAYHAGFNHGFNCAEAVNFVLPDWIPFGRLCLQRYRQFRKPPVFSHDQLILNIIKSYESGEISEEVTREFDLIITRLKAQRSKMASLDVITIREFELGSNEAQTLACHNCQQLMCLQYGFCVQCQIVLCFEVDCYQGHLGHSLQLRQMQRVEDFLQQ
ncbi:hypothetical protein MP228_002695 [Amoeboaphelidium protococcarum]|nr:hypothetical protein MP228_002695 [Amoeboaphelidium protococcarum]